ncbi:DNAJ heat shock N-terminal domain-containing family protein [Dorcoceras hygrometricum]|uniref:DNAJ heat shock N-terminal domain-containing family protein n=1 Tax=Dorcoceras hygrometricum TaxID=472368 RepID=A0A2Z7DB65_9LAMI|nr:DNAJ heat shock N-terminal domain-containing family protein [Dorcoceras hygrometricum]
MVISSKRSLLLITYSDEILDGEPIYVCSNSLPVKGLSREPAGHAFHAAALRLLGFEEVHTEKDGKEVSEDKDNVYVQSSDAYSSKGRKKSGSESKQQDHYALLGLSHLRYLATEDQIRKSYREAALRHHPDKQAALLLAEETEAAKQAKKDEIESHFKAIQEAYEVLIDPVRRRIYDSTDEFDDEIPSDCAPHEFYKVFGPAFLRNGRWSVNQPVPTLGDDNTPFKEVDSFYDFWYSFKSWREFPHADEFELDQAESREHRRWMERQNAKLSEGARKEEYARIRALVDNAYKRDPRLLRRKEEQKAEKLRKKEAKLLAKRLQEEEEARIVEEERRRKEEEEKRAAEAASNQKKMKEREKKLLRKERTRLRSLQHLFCPSICSILLIAIWRISALEVDDKDKDEKQDEKNLQQNGSVTINGKIAQSSNEKREKPWPKEEIELLRKGMQKYPKGTSRRWEVISEYIGTNRSVEEILKATKTVLLQKPDSANSFDSFLEKRNEVSDDSSVANGIASGSDEDIWSAVQEKALIQALKTFPKDTNQRWERVAAAVPGKSVDLCKKKFVSLKENFRNKKSAV